MKKYNVVIVGGGSTFTPGIVKSLLTKKDELPIEELRLYDIDKERQDKVAVIVKHVIDQFDCDTKLVVTTEPEEAFTNIDFALAQIRVGKYAMREKDEKIALAHDCVGQETCGVGGMAYALRTIYPMVEICDFCEKYANKNYWIINYSNPASIVAEALRKLRPNARIMNICDMPVGIISNMANILNVKPEEITVNYFGLNHFGWFTNVYVNGVDRIDEIRKTCLTGSLKKENSEKVDEQHADKTWVKTYGNLKYMVEAFPEYIPNTYMQYYLLQDYIVKNSDKNYTRANEVMDGREKKLFEGVDQYLKTGVMDNKTFFVGVHGEFIADVAVSLAKDLRKRYLVIVENNGAIPNLPDDAMVEIPAYITSNGPEPVRVGEIPLFYKGLIEQQLASEKLLVEAAIENSYEKALMSFTLNKTVPSVFVARDLLDEYITANEGYWPELL